MSGWTGTDDCHLLPAWLTHWHFHSHRPSLVAGDVSFKRSCQHRSMCLDVRAGTLTELLLRANPPAYLRHTARLAVHLGCFKEFSLLNQPHRGWDVIVGWARFNTWSWVRAMHTARSFEHRLLRCHWDANIIKITYPLG